MVRSQLVRLATGSSSSRARVQEDDFLKAVFVPIPDKKTQSEIHQKMQQILKKYWLTSQLFLKEFVACQNKLLSNINIEHLRSI